MTRWNWYCWGRDTHKNYSVEFGNFMRIDVKATGTPPEPYQLIYPKNAPKSFATALEAMEAAEKQLASDMPRLLDDWAKFEPGKARKRWGPRKRSGYRPRVR